MLSFFYCRKLFIVFVHNMIQLHFYYCIFIFLTCDFLENSREVGREVSGAVTLRKRHGTQSFPGSVKVHAQPQTQLMGRQVLDL